MKKLFFLFLIFFASRILSAQGVQTISGPELEEMPGSRIVKIIGEDANGVYLLRIKKSGEYYLEKFSKQLVFESSIPLVLPLYENKPHDFSEVLTVKGNIYLFSSYYDKTKKQKVLNASKLDLVSGKASGTAMVTSISGDNMKYDPYLYYFSPDSARLLIVKILPVEKNQPEKLGFKVVDGSLNPVWEKDLTMPYNTTKTGFLKEVSIDRAGNLYLLARVKEGDKKEARYYYELLSYQSNAEALKVHPVKIGDDPLVSAQISFDKDDQLIGGGFYRNQITDNLKGVFYFTFSKGSMTAVKSIPFSDEVLNKIGTKNKKNELEIKDYKVRKVLVSGPGKLTLVAEYYNYSESQQRLGDKYITLQNWAYGNVLVTDITTNDGKVYFGLIPKGQYSSTSGASVTKTSINPFNMDEPEDDLTDENHPTRFYGIAILSNGEQVGIIYNDHPKNLDGDNASVTNTTLFNTNTVLAIAKPDGAVERTLLFKTRDKDQGQKSFVIPRFYTQTSVNSIIILAQARKYYRLVKVWM